MTNKLYVIGLGPGDAEYLTPAARTAIEKSTIVTGYQVYLDLIAEQLPGKETFSTGMRQETERCREALRRAAEGATVSLVCSGDAGIYGMAGLVLELQQAEGPHDVEVEIVPGISAVQGAAARLGAPLMHDFAVISLSDLLTDWQLILQRLEAAAAADFVIALYNPKSRGRVTQVEEAQRIFLAHRDPATPVGIVRNACREGEVVTVTDLASFTSETIDMFSLVIIGNASSFVDEQGRMVTPRGYRLGRGENPTPAAPCPTPAIFIAGTGSDVGKSVIAAGICRLLKRQGMQVAPFKAQNMANNAAVCADGGEIGRAQALQAVASGLEPRVDMNPVLLKPNSDTGSQVIVQGRPVGNMDVADYHAYRDTAWQAVCESYTRLASEYELLVMEGAGSIAEINLRQKDITNLSAAAMAGAKVLLVADIERGGVFASILGTLQLLTPEEREMVAGVVINKFRGDAGLLASGIQEIEVRTGVPVIGVIPWLDLQLPAEDSLALEQKRQAADGSGLKIGVVRLPRISNFSDFDPLEREPGVELLYLDRPDQLPGLDLLILPGSKSTLADRGWLRERGLAGAIRAYHAHGGRVIGICGGYQLLGQSIADPQGVEGVPARVAGLGLLDIETVMEAGKQTHQVTAELLPNPVLPVLPPGEVLQGYEIHMGRTSLGPQAAALLRLRRPDGESCEDGAVSQDGRVWGTYLHDLFSHAGLRQALLGELRSERGLETEQAGSAYDLGAELDRLADHLQQSLDLDMLWSLTGVEAVLQR